MQKIHGRKPRLQHESLRPFHRAESVPVADPNSRTLNGPSASADDKESHGGTCEDRAATATQSGERRRLRWMPHVHAASRELKASNRHVVHSQLPVRISLHPSFSCRWPALIRGRSHPTRFASGAGSLYAIRSMERRVLPAGADSRSLAPHSLRERDLARCSQRYN